MQAGIEFDDKSREMEKKYVFVRMGNFDDERHHLGNPNVQKTKSRLVGKVQGTKYREQELQNGALLWSPLAAKNLYSFACSFAL